MKWTPKPYYMRGWDFKFEKGEAVAVPEFEELTEKISEAAQELSRRISECENGMILRSLSEDTLKTLSKMCLNEVKNREKLRKDFKV